MKDLLVRYTIYGAVDFFRSWLMIIPMTKPTIMPMAICPTATPMLKPSTLHTAIADPELLHLSMLAILID
ncbi:hypothetical protein CAP48_12570 [Advenella sp. S44]|nr:hypothetical protein CAP48_12570 [Advenella sp. S44]